MNAEKLWKLALGVAAGALVVHVLSGVWNLLFFGGLLVAAGSYIFLRFIKKVSPFVVKLAAKLDAIIISYDSLYL